MNRIQGLSTLLVVAVAVALAGCKTTSSSSLPSGMPSSSGSSGSPSSPSSSQGTGSPGASGSAGGSQGGSTSPSGEGGQGSQGGSNQSGGAGSQGGNPQPQGWPMPPGPGGAPTAGTQGSASGGSSSGVVDVRIARDQDDVAGIPAERLHLLPRHRQERGDAEALRPVLAIGEEFAGGGRHGA